MLSIVFPNITPVAFSVGSIDIRWYSLAYIVGALGAFFYLKYLNKNLSLVPQPQQRQFFDDLLFYTIVGVLLGGRLGYVVFYGFSYYMTNPLEIFYLWEGGMSYHGGLIGVIIMSYFLSKKYKMYLLQITDIIVPGMPIGLFLGRIANFINAELYGKPTDLPWGVIFPNVDLPRHPSQLYEAGLEGIFLFVILLFLWKKEYYKQVGVLSSITLILYAIFRIMVECVRVGEIYFFDLISMGQVLSLIMLICGVVILLYAKRKNIKSH